jgi:hypothetical protein
MKVYAFDVDHTLELSDGPIELADIEQLKDEGHVVGICGNWRTLVHNFPEWKKLFSFIGPKDRMKVPMLKKVRAKYPHADEYVMVGNIPGVTGSSDDIGAAKEAGWSFIQEASFARGIR